MDIAKRLIDFNFHAPTVYFPLIVPEAMMIEPTETESRETLESFARTIARHRRGRPGVPPRCAAHDAHQPARRGQGRQVAGPQVEARRARHRLSDPEDGLAWTIVVPDGLTGSMSVGTIGGCARGPAPPFDGRLARRYPASRLRREGPMSRDPGEPGSRPPRRNRPAPDLAKRPPPLPLDGDAQPSTFRPNPAPGPAPVKPRKPKSKSTAPRDPLDERPRVTAEGPNWWERILFGRVSSGQLAQFSRQFGTYLNAGVDITRSLSSLEKQFSGTALGPVIGRMQVAIKRGASLEDAMSSEPQTFGPMYLSMIRVAEARGGVPETLKMLAQSLEARQRLIRQARSAMIYPVIVLVIAGGVVALITVFLLPMFVVVPEGPRGQGRASPAQPDPDRVQPVRPLHRLVAGPCDRRSPRRSC